MTKAKTPSKTKTKTQPTAAVSAAPEKPKGPSAAAAAAAFAHTGAAAISDASASKLAEKLTGLDVHQMHEDEAAKVVQAAYQAVTETARISHGQALLIVAQLRAAG